ncbi:LysE family translocator [Streptomyces sp. SAJ15]|uniref:LysE family translocator n=1 Tax=Streptomyces sp. SAJ15 TaxID=2011095 RepID=UPI0021B2DA59|nr:LysE family translocator [Streptomyces sp. SAJ15]
MLTDPGHLLLFVAASVALIGLPGPNVLYICTRSMTQGTAAGLVSALGVETGTLVHVLATAFGVAALVSAQPWALEALTLLGAGYLAHLGARSLAEARSTDRADGTAAPTHRLPRVYGQGVLVNVLNPKVMLFFLAFLPQWVSEGATGTQARTEMLVLGAITFLLGLVMDLAYASAAGVLGHRLPTRALTGRSAKYTVAAVYFGLAITTVLT